MAARALSRLGAARRRGGVRGGSLRAGGARAVRVHTTVFDHHYVFPRGTTGLVEAEVQAARELGVRIVASRGSMDLGESAGGLPARWWRRRMRCSLRPRRWPGGCTARARRDGAGRGRSLLAVLGDEAADGRLGEAGAAAWPPAPHIWQRRWRKRLTAGLCTAAPVEYLAELGDRAGRLVRALRPSLAGGRADVRVGRGRRCTLSHVQPAAGSGCSAGEGAGRRRRAGGAGRRRLGVE